MFKLSIVYVSSKVKSKGEGQCHDVPQVRISKANKLHITRRHSIKWTTNWINQLNQLNRTNAVLLYP